MALSIMVGSTFSTYSGFKLLNPFTRYIFLNSFTLQKVFLLNGKHSRWDLCLVNGAVFEAVRTQYLLTGSLPPYLREIVVHNKKTFFISLRPCSPKAQIEMLAYERRKKHAIHFIIWLAKNNPLVVRYSKYHVQPLSACFVFRALCGDDKSFPSSSPHTCF